MKTLSITRTSIRQLNLNEVDVVVGAGTGAVSGNCETSACVTNQCANGYTVPNSPSGELARRTTIHKTTQIN